MLSLKLRAKQVLNSNAKPLNASELDKPAPEDFVTPSRQSDEDGRVRTDSTGIILDGPETAININRLEFGSSVSNRRVNQMRKSKYVLS